MQGPPSAEPKRGKIARARVVTLGLAAVLLSAFVGVCWLWDVRSLMDIRAYRAMIHERYHPIWKDLAWRTIRKGDAIEDVLKRHPPLQQEDFLPYTVLRYHPIGSSGRLVIEAKDGKLICAMAGSDSSSHFFFDSPEEEEAIDSAYLAYLRQRALEGHALQIHQAIRNGQDIFLARVINGRGSSGGGGYDGPTLAEMKLVYGEEYMRQIGLIEEDLTVEVTTVLHGDLQTGAVLTFPGDNCYGAEAGEPECVFLHVHDMHLLDPQKEVREGYTTVPRKALDWYQSLTPEQVKNLEATGLARQSQRWQAEKLPTRPPRKARQP